MKRILAALLVLVALMIPVSSAGAASPEARQIKTLQKQVKVLQKQVKTLQKQTKTLQTLTKLTGSLAITSYRGTVCTLAMVADTFQATWKVLDDNGIPGGVVGATPFHSLLTPLDDYGACTDLTLTRQMGLGAPSWTAYNSLIGYLYSP